MVNILIHVGHPAHVHFYKYAMQKLEKLGHNVYVTAVDKEHTKTLLKEYDIAYETVGVHKKGLPTKFMSMLSYDKKFIKIIKEKKINASTGVGSPSIAQAGYFTKTPSIIFTDTEAATIGNKFMAPFATIIATPVCYKGDFGVKHKRYKGYQELAYLHPNYFKPDARVLADNGLTEDDTYTVVRFVSRVSIHDRGDIGLGANPIEVVGKLKKFGKVLISSEGALPEKLSENLIKKPSGIHSLLHYASLYIGESPTMATEAAILGTPSIYAQKSHRSYTEELEKKYELVYNFHDPRNLSDKAISKASKLYSADDSKKLWLEKRERLLSDKVDVTEFIVNLLLSTAV